VPGPDAEHAVKRDGNISSNNRAVNLTSARLDFSRFESIESLASAPEDAIILNK
jgi:hypothetical protein